MTDWLDVAFTFSIVVFMIVTQLEIRKLRKQCYEIDSNLLGHEMWCVDRFTTSSHALQETLEIIRKVVEELGYETETTGDGSTVQQVPANSFTYKDVQGDEHY